MITIRPETAEQTLVIEASEKLTAKDYKDVFIPKLEQLLQQFEKIRIVFYLNDSFDGWELEAMWDDAKFGFQHRKDFTRIAVVGGPRWVAWATRLGTYFIPGELKIFDTALLAEAITWAKQ